MYRRNRARRALRIKPLKFAADTSQRLNVQHKVLKVMQDDKNYVAPMDVVLKAEEGREGRVLDVGAGEHLSLWPRLSRRGRSHGMAGSGIW